MGLHFLLKHGCSKTTGPNCSKLTMSLVNDSLKFTSSDTQIQSTLVISTPLISILSLMSN